MQTRTRLELLEYARDQARLHTFSSPNTTQVMREIAEELAKLPADDILWLLRDIADEMEVEDLHITLATDGGGILLGPKNNNICAWDGVHIKMYDALLAFYEATVEAHRDKTVKSAESKQPDSETLLRCAGCNKDAVKGKCIPYSTKVSYQGQLCDVHMPSMPVLACQHCGQFIIPNASLDLIVETFRQNAYLLTSTDIKAMLKQRGMSERALADKLGLATSVVTDWLRNVVIQPRDMDERMRAILSDDSVEVAVKSLQVICEHIISQKPCPVVCKEHGVPHKPNEDCASFKCASFGLEAKCVPYWGPEQSSTGTQTTEDPVVANWVKLRNVMKNWSGVLSFGNGGARIVLRDRGNSIDYSEDDNDLDKAVARVLDWVADRECTRTPNEDLELVRAAIGKDDEATKGAIARLTLLLASRQSY